MLILIAIALGGALGAVLRYGVSISSAAVWGTSFPYGTLIVNITGSLFIGIFYAMFQDRMVAPETRALIQIGLLGAFTTFSTFSLETLKLMEQGDVLRAGMNISFNLVLCLLATWAGLLVGRQL